MIDEVPEDCNKFELAMDVNATQSTGSLYLRRAVSRQSPTLHTTISPFPAVDEPRRGSQTTTGTTGPSDTRVQNVNCFRYRTSKPQPKPDVLPSSPFNTN